MIFKKYFKSTIRRLSRDRSYLITNVLSLAIGLLCCLFIFSYVQDELSYDTFHKNANNIFRIEIEVSTEDGADSRYAILGTSPVDWLHQVPEIELETRFARFYGDMIVETNGDTFTENRILAADSSFFNLFSFKIIKGSPASALANPNCVVLTESTARKYFGSTDVLGETLKLSFLDWEALLTITGVAEDVPSNSHFSFDIVTSAAAYEKINGVKLSNFPNAYSYIRVTGNASTNDLREKINELYTKNDLEAASTSRFLLRSLTDIHLHSSAIDELSANSNANYIYLFAFIAFIILGIGCVNFATLATSRSVHRAREIGMRKVFGAESSGLRIMVLLEALSLAFVALVATYFIAWFFLQYFNELAGKSIAYTDFFDPSFLLMMLGMTLVVGIVSGLYPALVLSRHKPQALLRENVTKSSRGTYLWKSMVVTQLAISLVLIGVTYIVQKQIDFIFTKNLGFEREQIITFPNYFFETRETFMDELEKHPNIRHATSSSYIPGASKKAGLSSVEAEGKSTTMTFEAIVIDPHFFETFDVKFIEGRNFSELLASDSTEAFIINKTAVQKLGWNEPLGKKMHAYGKDGYVIGVVEDFNFTSLHNEITPMVFLLYDSHYARISAKVKSAQNMPQTLSYIESKWKELAPGMPFRYEFLDDQFAALYESEQRARTLFFSFSILAITIAILGLFSFASYTIQQKTREIGIRKVLGATVQDILKLFYTGYAKLLLIAVFIALPIGYLWMNSWLENFAYRTKIEAEVVGIPLLLVMVILLVSVSYQAVKGALQNPADTIRAE